MAKIAMAIDLDYCVGCFACESACKMANRLPDGTSWLKVHPRHIVSEEYMGRLVMDRFPIPVNVEMCYDCHERTGCFDYECSGREKGVCHSCDKVTVEGRDPVCATSCLGQALFVGSPEKAQEWSHERRSAMFTA